MKSEVLAHSIGGAAKALNCGRTKLYELLSEGRIKAKKLGTRTIIPDSELVSLLDSLPDADFGKPPRGGAERLRAPPHAARPATAGRLGEARLRASTADLGPEREKMK